jgi:hypothetical protein
MVCKVCGRAPAQEFKLRRHVGMIVMQRFVWFKGPLYRDHGIEMSQDYLFKTLIQGWWGVISFFVNWFAVYTDVSALSKAKKMAPPVALQPPAAPQPPTAAAEPTPPASGQID